MSRMKLLVGTVLALGVGLGMSAPALAIPCSAGVCTYTGSVASALTDFTDVSSGSYFLFDPSLGTLTGASFTLAGNISTSGTITNPAAGPVTYTVTVNSNININDIGTDPLANYLKSLASELIVQDSQKFTNLASGIPTSYGPQNGSNSQTFTISDFSPFIGNPSDLSNPISVYSTTQGSLTILGNSGNLNTVLTTYASDSWTLTYDYDPAPVPEPATIALLATGLIGLGVVRRRKRG